MAAAPALTGKAPLVDLGAGAAAATAPVEPERLVVVFDNVSLEKRARKRAVKALREFAAQRAAGGGEVMIAVLRPELEILGSFSADAAAVDAALSSLEETDASGDMVSSTKRMLQRDIATVQLGRVKRTFDLGGMGPGGSTGGGGGGGGPSRPPTMSESTVVDDDAYIAQQSQQLRARVDVLRYQERDRIFKTLVGLDGLTRSLSGLGGRKEILWVGQDLALRPAIDVYDSFFERFSQWATELNLDHPHRWATEADLTDEFKFVAAGAQAAGATLHFMDCADRDAANTDIGSSRLDTQTMVEGGGTRITSGYDFAMTAELVEGSRYLAGATGGSTFFNSRQLDDYLAALGGQLGSYYSNGYRRPGAADGQLHAVKVALDGAAPGGSTVNHHEKILNRTPVQKLADETLSRLQLGVGFDDLGLQAELGAPEPAADDQLIRAVKLFIPARNLVLADEGANQVGRVLVALQSQGSDGTTYPPQVMQLTIAVPSDRLSPVTTTSATLRLLMRSGTAKVAVGVVDAASGAASTRLIEVDGS